MMQVWGMFLILVLVGGLVLWYRRRTVQEHHQETIYQTVRVQRRGSIRSLRFDSRGQQGAIDLRDPERILFPYQQVFLLHRCLLPDVESFLSIGVGTGTALQTARRLYPTAMLYGVEIDPEVIRVAHRFFDCPYDERTYYVAMDGRRFVEETEATFDLVLLDAYADDQVPPRLETVEFVQALKGKMSERGVVCINLIASLRGIESNYLREIWRTYREHFQHVMIVPTSMLAWDSQNLLVFATDTPLPTQEDMLKQIADWPWPVQKRRLLRMAKRMVVPDWELEQETILTDQKVYLFEHRSTRS